MSDTPPVKPVGREEIEHEALAVAERITEGWWDMPAIENREEFLACLAQFLLDGVYLPLIAEVRQLREEREQACASLKPFNHCEDDTLTDLAEVAASSFSHAMHRAEVAEAELAALRSCSACEPAWTPIGIMDSAPCRKCGRVIDLRIFHEMQEQNAGLLRGNVQLAADVNRKADERDALRSRLEVGEKALRRIAEGNLGPNPWQADYDAIREVACAALKREDATAKPTSEEKL